jgi:hypothetical protein
MQRLADELSQAQILLGRHGFGIALLVWPTWIVVWNARIV